jgi:hypothetical protein
MSGSRCQRDCWLIACFISLIVVVPLASAAGADETSARPIKVLGARRLPEQDIAAMRTPLGIPNDYKPWLMRLDGDKLLMVAYSFGGVPSNELPQGEPYLERAVFWRSADGGNTWGAREEHPDVHGREFALNRLSDGTLLMPCHFLGNDAANKVGHTYSKLFRSTVPFE